MMTYKEARKAFYIYKCVAKRDDESEIVRILKIQSYFDVSDLSLALTAMSDAVGLISEVKVENEEHENKFKYGVNDLFESASFYELDNKDLTIEILFEDGISNVYKCEYVGMDIQDKNITRKTPICVYANGFSRLGARKTRQKELESYKVAGLDLSKYVDNDSVYSFPYNEKMKTEEAIKDLIRFFNYEKEKNYISYKYNNF